MGFGREFLVQPDLFPARVAGEPWGEESWVFDLPGGPYHLVGLTPEQRESLQVGWGFLGRGEDQKANVAVRVFRAADADFREFPLAGWETRFDLEAAPREVRLAGRRFVSLFELGAPGQEEGSRPKVAIWTAASDPGEFLGVVENVLRVAVAYQLLGKGGVLLHAAAVVPRSGVETGARLFAGVSGAGKSTAAHLSHAAGHTVLSDDLSAVVPAKSGFEVLWSPFSGDFRGRGPNRKEELRVPLAAICCIEKSLEPYSCPLRSSEALGRLVQIAPYVNRDPYRLSQLLEVLAALIRAVSVVRLGFRRDPSFWDILLAGETDAISPA